MQKKDHYKHIYERNTKMIFTVHPSGPDRTDLRESESARASWEASSLLLLSFRPQTRKDNKRARRARLAQPTLIGISKFVQIYDYASRWQSKYVLFRDNYNSTTTGIHFTQISLTWVFKRFPFLITRTMKYKFLH